jgi:hypothetical protein
MRMFGLAAPLLLSGLAASSCGSPPAGKTARNLAQPAPGAASVPTASAARAARKVRPSIPALPPPPVVKAPMQGEPSPVQLKEARLVSLTCEKASAEEADALVKEMRAAVDLAFKEQWHDEQPACWEADREAYRWRKEMEAGGGARSWARKPSPNDPWGASLADAMGSAAGAPRAMSPAPAPAAKAEKPSNEPAAASKHSRTNNQVASVDEADIVKTDGKYVYIASNGALRIIEAMNPRVLSTTAIAGGATREIFVEGDRAVVYSANGGSGAARCTYGYDCQFGGDGSTTKVTVLDIANRNQPRVVRQLDLSGSLIAARRIGNAVHTVVADGDSGAPPYETWPSDLETCGVDEKIVRAKFAKLKADNERKIRAKRSFPTMKENGGEQQLCAGGLLRTGMRDGQAFTSVISFDLTDDKAPPASSTIQSRPGAVFASQNALYLSVAHQKAAAQARGARWYSFYPTVDEASEIHKFTIGTSPRETRYAGSGVVPGHVLNQFAMDEWNGYLRVATTRGKVPDPNVSSSISVLAPVDNGNLVRVGAIDKIAPGEDIRAVRFDDERGYVVTFKKTDPLFVVDLYQPAQPRILGELKIPGFSTYIHRIDPTHLLSIGFDANDHGDFAYFDGIILQLFDVTKPTDPKLVHKEKIGTRGSSSQAATDHLAFNWFASEGLLAIPMTICEGGGDGRHGDQLAFSGLLVYDVDVERGFTRLGGVDHGKQGVSCGTWWSNANSAVKRSVFLDDLVYSIAGDRAKVQRMSHFGVDVADISL